MKNVPLRKPLFKIGDEVYEPAVEPAKRQIVRVIIDLAATGRFIVVNGEPVREGIAYQTEATGYDDQAIIEENLQFWSKRDEKI